MNAHDIVLAFFQQMISRGFVPEEDIAWVGVPVEFLQQLGSPQRCPIRDCMYCKVDGVEFRECPRNSYDGVVISLDKWFAWNITGRTKKLFNWNEK